MYLVDVPEVFRDRIKFLVIHVGYGVVPEVSHDRTMFLATPRVLRRRPRGFPQQNHVSSNTCVLRRRPKVFHDRTMVLVNSRVLH